MPRPSDPSLRDLEREPSDLPRRRVVLDPRGTLKQRFDPDPPTPTQAAIDGLRRAGLL